MHTADHVRTALSIMKQWVILKLVYNYQHQTYRLILKWELPSSFLPIIRKYI